MWFGSISFTDVLNQENRDKLGKDDFVDFLEDEFKVCCKKIPELEAAKGKPQKTMVILRNLKDEEIKDSTKIKDLTNFIEKNLLQEKGDGCCCEEKEKSRVDFFLYLDSP